MQLEAAAQLSVYRGITLTRKVQAFGTTEGAIKGWDTRGRGRKALPKAPAVLRQHGWAEHPSQQLPDSRVKGWNHHVWEHPKFGKLEIGYGPGGKFKHFQDGQVVYQSKVKPGGTKRLNQAVDDYLTKLEGKPPVAAPAPQVQAPVAQPATPEASGRDVQTLANKLSTAKVTSSKDLGGGVNVTKILTLADGTKAVFKPAYGMGAGTVENEIAASKVAQIVGLMDMAPVVVERTIDGKRGALLEYQEGKAAGRVDENHKYDGKEDCGRALVFDYVIGNTDRHDGNWLVDTAHDDKLHLIDHGISFPRYDPKWISSYMKESLDYRQSIPDSTIKPYKDSLPAIQQTLKGLGIHDEAIAGVTNRINKLGTTTVKWQDIT